MTKWLRIIVAWLLITCVYGCATIDTISSAKPGSPKFFSGTRLDINALSDNKVAMKKFQVEPPKYPMLDLPASFAADLFMSPLTQGAALYEVIFE